jgi:hypothetical protein
VAKNKTGKKNTEQRTVEPAIPVDTSSVWNTDPIRNLNADRLARKLLDEDPEMVARVQRASFDWSLFPRDEDPAAEPAEEHVSRPSRAWWLLLERAVATGQRSAGRRAVCELARVVWELERASLAVGAMRRTLA